MYIKTMRYYLISVRTAIVKKGGASLIAQSVKNLPATQELRFGSWVGKMPYRRKWQPSPIFLPEESHGQKSLAGYSPWGCKSQIQLRD